MNFSPAAVVQPLPLNRARGRVHVVRDDLLEGGTKQRAALPFLAGLQEEGFQEFVYASPFSGFAQIALAVSAQALGLRSHVFAVREPAVGSEPTPHEFSRKARAHGAQLTLAEDLAEASDRAAEYAAADGRRYLVPLGFDHPEFHRHLVAALREQWSHFGRKLPGPPRNVWVPLGSGTLGRAFRQVVPEEIGLDCVNVHVLPDTDARIVSLAALRNVRVHSAEERFAQPARLAAPVPSNRYYDAKLWRFVSDHAEDGDVWWNVAR